MPTQRDDEPRAMGVDGVLRPRAEEERLNATFRALFDTSLGREVIAYLKMLTVNQVLGPRASDAELRDMEGRRFIVALIDRRTTRGRTADIPDTGTGGKRRRNPRFVGTRPGKQPGKQPG